KFRSRDEARRLAEELVLRARKGENFLQLSKQYDHGDSAYRNGEGLGQRRGEIKPNEAEPVLFQMRDGDVSLVELPTGYHVIRLEKRTHAGQMPLNEKLQGEVRRKLQNQVAEREAKKLVAELKRKASIEIVQETP